ncbi:IDEAL domain-containing protein [Oceanobacillus sp. 143]|nr:IDEAL domain-containing protein [Oceanobacillus sp. 143]
MNTPNSINDKKGFIQWFLNHYQLKKRESVWILNYLVNHKEILTNVHFVQDVKFTPRGIVMTAHCSDEVPFRFYKNQLVTTDAEKSFHDIRLNQQEDLYIQLNFKNANQNAYYASIMEENPFIPDDYFITKRERDIAKQILDKTVFDYKRKILLKEIDQALDEMDQEKFITLSNQLHILEKGFFIQPKLQRQ